jgi:uncharacterized protein YndB with AHSA1/START domain
MADVTIVQNSYSASADALWRAVTDPALLARWLGECDGLTLEEGCHFSLRLPARPWFDGAVECEVTHVDDGRTWQMSWSHAELPEPTLARLSVIATPTGSRLEVTHSGFSGGGFKMKILHLLGWQKVLRFDLARVIKGL